MKSWRRVLLAVAAFSATIPLAYAQAPADTTRAGAPAAGAPAAAAPRLKRPALFFKEDWKQTPQGGEHPVTLDSIGNPSLELKLYVPAGEVLLTGSADDEGNPIHVWMGMCTSPCAVAFREKSNFADLTGLARIRWNTKTSGFHQVRPIVKLADGTWLVGDHADGTTRDWLISEISYADLHWLKLDIARVVTTGTFLDKVDLSKVDEIGFADLMPGSGHGPGGWSDVAQVEVYGSKVARASGAGTH
jgi:hypothetical protein